MKRAKLSIDVQKIQVKTAFRLMYHYLLRFQNVLRKEDGSILKGFSFTRDDIEKILFEKDEHGNFKRDQNGNYINTQADYVHVAFGHHFGDAHPNDQSIILNRPTLIAFGMKEDKTALLTNETVFNYCDPCPTRCPTLDAAATIIENEVLLEHFPEHKK